MFKKGMLIIMLFLIVRKKENDNDGRDVKEKTLWTFNEDEVHQSSDIDLRFMSVL